MEAGKHRQIKSGVQYDHLFPRAFAETHTVRKNAEVGDTVAFIPQVVGKTLHHTKGIAAVLKGRNDYDTCRNIWRFVYSHIAYRKDKDGYEQIRSPARCWHDRKSGVDCDCYTTLISSILTNLGIRHVLRITRYSRPYFQHIYPVALLPGNKRVILDCVTDTFDYEVPFSEKKDYPMDLQYLSGLDDGYGYQEGAGSEWALGKVASKKGKKKHHGLHIDLKKALNVINKVNPATVALRNGVLASLKLNIGNIAKRLRWSYMTAEQAKAKGVNLDRWQKLVKARQKLEDIFYKAGGKPSNFKKAILNGKGNKDHAVHGLEGLGSTYPYADPMSASHPVNHLSRNTPLRQLLGDELFFSENDIGTLGALGEPASMAMITAASGVIAAIAATLHKIGDIFGGKGKGSQDFDEQANADAEKEIPKGGDSPADSSSGSGTGDGGGSDGGSTAVEKAAAPDSGEADGGGIPAKSDAGEESKAKEPEGDDPEKQGFFDKNKKWIIPAGIGVAALGLLAVVAQSRKKPSPASGRAVNGTPGKGGKNHHRKKKQSPKKIMEKQLL